jgi:hypothetical protein
MDQWALVRSRAERITGNAVDIRWADNCAYVEFADKSAEAELRALPLSRFL